MEPVQGSMGEDARSQVMSAQAAPTRMVNGIDPVPEELRGEGTHGERGRSGDGDERTRAAGEEAAGNAPLPGTATGLAPQQSRDMPSRPRGDPDGVSAQQQARQEAFLEIADAGSARAPGTESRGLEVPSSHQGFLTPRSHVTTTPGTTWLSGVEVPRWVARLGSYLSIGAQGDPLLPSPLAGSVTHGSPPGGHTFMLRSPGRRERVPRPPTPSSSSIPAEAIQLEVQRQLSGILGRLHEAEQENNRLREDLERERLRGVTGTLEQQTLTSEPPTSVHAMQRDQTPPLLPPSDTHARPQVPPATSVPTTSGLFSGQVPIFGGPLLPEPSRGLWGNLLTAPSGPSVHAGEPPVTSVPTTTEANPIQAPQHQGEGILRSWLGSRSRSPTPPPQPTTSPQGSPVIDALTKSIQQLQELQAQALVKGSTSTGTEQVKPGTTTLAPLPDPRGGCEAAIQFQDWLEVACSVLSDVSEQSGQWWREVIVAVEGTYEEWLAATPLERLAVVPKNSETLTTGRWMRLNARVSSMLLSSMGESLRSDMVGHRITQDAVRMVFRMYTVFQPGGSAERQDVLKRLQFPQDYMGTETAEDALKAIRAWPRWLSRCRAVGMSPPDASVLARGLMAMTTRYINQSPDAAFRTSMLRTSLRLDAQPTVDQVIAYQRHLQAELETIVNTNMGSATTTTPGVRAIEKDTSPKQRTREKSSTATPDLCRYFMKPSGCKRGSKCTFSHSMSTLDRETRNKKCLQCGAENHRARECPVGKPQPRGGAQPTSPTGKDNRPPKTADGGPAVSSMSAASTMLPSESSTMASTSTVHGTPWTLEALVQAAQQVVQTQQVDGSSDKSPEKTRPEVKTLIVKDIRISALHTSSAALLDSGATHNLRNARSASEWSNAEDVMVQLAGTSKLAMKISPEGTLLMPPRTMPRSTLQGEGGGQTIVSVGELVETLGYTLVWSPDRCVLQTAGGEELPLSTRGGCPHLCEAEALALIARLEDRKRERLENETVTTLDRIEIAAVHMDRHWFDNLREYVESESMEAGVRSLRDAEFLQMLPGTCLDGLLQGDLRRDSWKVMKGVHFLTRPQRRYLWTAKRWIVHLFAGAEGHHQIFHLDERGTAVIELDFKRCRGHDLMDPAVWRMLMWGAINGKVDAVIGGPPGRGGVGSHTGDEGYLDNKPMKLIARMLWLYATASAARRTTSAGGNKDRPVAFMMEHPADDEHKGDSVWNTPMWKAFEKEMGMCKLTFNQAAMGGEDVRTTIGTNIYYLMGLDQVGLEDSEMSGSRRGSSGIWSSGFVNALVLAMKFWEKAPRSCPVLARLSAEQWKRHVQSNHADYQRDCLACVMGRGTGRRHARVRHPDMFTMTVDVAGPVKPGLDVSSKGTMGKGLRYMMIAKYTLPKEYVKGYTGQNPPDDHGLDQGQQSGQPEVPQPDKEIARPSLPLSRDGGECLQQSGQPEVPQPNEEIARPSLPLSRDGGECLQQSGQPEVPQPDEEIARPSLPLSRDGGECLQQSGQPEVPQPDEEIARPSLPLSRDGGDPFSFEDLECAGEESFNYANRPEQRGGPLSEDLDHPVIKAGGFVGSSRAQREGRLDYEDSLYDPSEQGEEEQAGHEEEQVGDSGPPSGNLTDYVIQDCEAPEATYLLFARPLPSNNSAVVKAAIQDIILYLNAHGLPVYRLHSDKGEVYCHSIRTWLREQGVRATFSEPGVPQGNGAAETTVRWLKDKARTLLIGARLPTRLWPTAVEAAAAIQRSKVLGGKSKLLAPYGAPVCIKQKAFDSSGPRRRERAFETRWIKGVYVGLSNILDNGHVVFVPGDETQKEKFFHTFHVRAGLVDPGLPGIDEVPGLEPPKPRRRVTEKTPLEQVELRNLSLSSIEIGEYIRDRSRVLLDSWDQEKAINLVDELAEHGFFDELKFGVFRHGGSVGWLKGFKEFPELTRVLARIILHDNPEATFTAIMVAKGNEKGMHRDFNNDEDAVNYVKPTRMPKRGGDLWVELGPGDRVVGEVMERRDEQGRTHYGQIYKIAAKTCNVFSPRRLHDVLPWEGKRTVLIAYTPQGLGKVTDEMIKELEEYDFVPPLTQYPEYFLLKENVQVKTASAPRENENGKEEVLGNQEPQFTDSDVDEWEMFLDTAEGMVKIGDQEEHNDEKFFPAAQKVEVTYTKGIEAILTGLKGPLEVTYTVDPREVHECLDKWASAIKKEVEGVSIAIKRLLPQSTERAEWFQRPGAQRLPTKLVFTVKPGDSPLPDQPDTWYKRKARLVVCGNYASNNEGDLYSETAPSEAVRIGLTMSRKRKWQVGLIDIIQAFLRTPLDPTAGDPTFIVAPPKVLERLSLTTTGEMWGLVRALYGLRQAPALWSAHRDRVLRHLVFPGQLHLRQGRTVTAWWVLKNQAGVIIALIIIYVDDILLLGEEATIKGIAGSDTTGLENLGVSDPQSGESTTIPGNGA